jgi:hypothetical protein
MKRLLRHPVVQALLARLLGRYLAFALTTTRWRVEGAEHLDPVGSAPTIVAFWHRRLPLMPILWLRVRRPPDYRPRRVHVLVSHHADGQFIGNVIRRFQMETVTGSSSRGCAAGLRSMMLLLEGGISSRSLRTVHAARLEKPHRARRSSPRWRTCRCCPARRRQHAIGCLARGTACWCRSRSAAVSLCVDH